MIKEVVDVLGVTLEHATTEHAQKIGLTERIHASLENSLNIQTSECRLTLHKYVKIAVLNHNTSYHARNGFKRSRPLHGRVLYSLFDF